MEPRDGLLHPTSSWINITPQTVTEGEHAQHERSLLQDALTNNPQWLIGRHAHKFFPDKSLRGSAENCRQKELQTVNLSFTLEFLRVHASSTTSAHHLGKHKAKLATLEIMVRAIRTRKIWPLASPRVLPKSLPNP